MSNLQKYINMFNLPAAILIMILAVACSALAAFATQREAGAAQYPAHPMSVRDDRCYSTLSTASGILGMFGAGNFGMVNAIVNVPVYDWDQGSTDLTNPRELAYRNYNLPFTPIISGLDGLRGSQRGKSLGYAENFDFTVTPVPNLQWIARYLTLQLPKDIRTIAQVAGAPLPSMPPTGTRNDPFIANPFIYMQSSLIMPNGIPQFQVVTGPLANLSLAQQHAGQGTSQSSLTNIINALTPEALASILTSPRDLLNTNSDLLNSLNGGGILTPGGLQSILNGTVSDVELIEGMVQRVFGDVVSLIPGISYPYSVRGQDPADNCYEDIASPNGMEHQVPSYAFSVPGIALPVTMPGWVFSLLTILDGKGPSSSGMTAYLGGSINGKAMLDCYGRGIVPTVTTGTGTIQSYVLNPFSVLNGLGSYLINAAIFAASGAIDGLAASGGIPPIGQAVRNMPPIVSAFETYTSGFAFLFDMRRLGLQLPSHVENRAIDFARSRESDINLRYAIGGLGHDESQNGQQFNPNLKITLKEPYVVTPSIDIGDNPRRTLDGTTVSVDINTNKHGFNKGDGSDRRYREDTRSSGGPTYDDNGGANGRSFSEARVYKIVMQPGVVPHAIDRAKVINQGEGMPYYGAPEINSGVDPCQFFAQKLQEGDDRAQPSSLPEHNGTNSNSSEVVTNGYTCEQVAQKDLRMDVRDTRDSLYSVEEKIPAETPPGTKICFAVYYSRYTNDLKINGEHWWDGTQRNYNSEYSAPTDATYLTRANCIVSGHKPSLQVRGGDFMVNGGVYTGLNTKDFLADDGDPKQQRTYGSWAEYGIIASGNVRGMGSGAIYRTGLVPDRQDFGYLTFTNNRTASNESNYGRYTGSTSGADEQSIDDGFANVSRQFSSMSGQATPLRAERDAEGNRQPIDINGLESGVYLLEDNNVDIVSSGVLPNNRSIVLLAGDGNRVNIAENITTPVAYETIGELSQVVIAPAGSATYTLNINHNVTQVDAWLINPGGTLSTCATPNGGIENTPRAGGPCNRPLTVNGPVAVEELLLRRDGGKDQSDAHPVAQSIPGENFNLRPDAYLWAANYVDSANKKFITTNAIDLPPRY